LARLKPGEESSLEYPVHGISHKPKWILENIMRLGTTGNTNDEQVFFGTFQDISQRKEVEQQLEKSRRILELSIKASNDGIWQYDVLSQRFTFSDRWFQILGYDRNELGNTFDVWLNLLHPEDKEAAKDKAFHALKMEVRYDDNYRLLHKDGHYIDVINRALFIKNDEQKVLQIIGSITDISSVKDSERKLRASEGRLQEAQHLARIANWSYNFETNTFEADDWYFEVAGLQDTSLKQELKANPAKFDALLDPQTFEKFTSEKDKAFQSLDYFEYVHKVVIKHRIIYIQTRMHIQRNEDGELKELIGTIQDVTAQKVKEQELEFAKKEAEEASRAKTQFLNTMSHEIRTPLNAVVGMAYLLEKENPRPEQLENLEILRQSSEHLLDLINNILDFNRIESGMISFEEEVISTRQFFQDIIRLWQPVAKQKNLSLQLILDYSLPPAVLADGLRLTQIINNLLNNAIKFTTEGNISLKVSKRKQKIDAVSLRIAVIDTGIGIPKSKQKEIFELFTQVHSHHDRRFGGSGLGLAICTKLLNFQGSELKVKSTMGKGSTFYFDLNFSIPDENQQIKQDKRSDKSETQKLRGVKVLLVEDNLVNRQVMKRFFDAWESEYQMADSGEKALDLLNDYQPDVILMDIQMPDMDGYETSRKIREKGDSFSKKVPIIALTASSMMDTRDKLQDAGIDSIIEKPFSPEKLYRCLSDYQHERAN
jgi:PAS domain S-box-containing protein